MSLPDLLASAVGEEDVVAHVDLGGEDALAVTPTRTLVYRSDGLLSDETVDAYPHGAERVDVSEGRRKTKITLDRGLDGEETITVPAKRTDDALHPILAGVLSAAGVTDPGESVISTFRFSELTLIITSDRLVKHIGSVVWDEEFEEFHYDGAVGLDFEEGTVATSVVLALADRRERFKAPNESAREVRETLTDAVCSYHDVESPAELRALREQERADDAADAAAESSEDGSPDFGVGVDPLSASPAADADAAAGSETDPAMEAADRNGDGSGNSRSGGSDDPLAPASAESTSADTASHVDAGTTASPSTDTANTTQSAAADADAVQQQQSGQAQDAASKSDASRSASVSATRERSDRGAGAGDDTAPAGNTTTDADFGDSGFEPAGVTDDDLAQEVAALRAAVEDQAEQLDKQTALIEQLIEELRRGR